jgi:hypothetical protein
MSAAHDDRRWRIIAQDVSATVERRPDGKYTASTGDSFSIANTPREAVAELFDVPPCDVIDPANHNARAIAWAIRCLADDESKKMRDGSLHTVAIIGSNYLQLLRSFEACAIGNYDEALRRFADITNLTAEEMRRSVK